ncbi:MAG TPA: glycosyl transferase [Peptococcaceae bacterium]|nr:glycosyl transferase [Peptococcaceae bacterium]
MSMLIDRQPPFKISEPDVPITILIAAHNEESNIETTLKYVALQKYSGPISVIIVDNASTDNTADAARSAAEKYRINLKILKENKKGKNFALNRGFSEIDTSLFITLDADTILHSLAVKNIVARLLSSPSDVGAVAGHVLVRNSRDNFWTKIQDWDYFLGIASIKRIQGLFQGTLVAQGAFSLYKTEAVRQAGMWPDAIGEDIVLTWKLMHAGYRVYFEPTAVAFTVVPKNRRHFIRHRSRWARGMFEGIRTVQPWKQPTYLKKFLTAVDLIIPFIDLFYTLVWVPGLILACFGKYYIVGPYTLLVMPLNILVSFVMLSFQKRIFSILNLKIRKNLLGLISYMLIYQIIISPISLWGYIQHILNLRRIWQ